MGVAITDDDIVEQQEEFHVVLEPESEFVDIGTNNVATVTISDNDSELIHNHLNHCPYISIP